MKAKCDNCGRYYKLKLRKGERLADFTCDCGRTGLSRATNAEVNTLDKANYTAAKHGFGHVLTPK